MLPKEHPDLIAIKHNLGKIIENYLNIKGVFLGELYVAMGNEEKASEFLLEALETIKELEEKQKKGK